MNSTVWNLVALYAAEIWTLTKASRKLLEAFEMWTWWRMLKISLTEKVTNEEVLVCANKARSILKMIWYRKHRWLGHVLRHENLLHDTMKGKMLGKFTRGRKRMELLHDMMEGRDCGRLKNLISDRSRCMRCMLETCWQQQKTNEKGLPWPWALTSKIYSVHVCLKMHEKCKFGEIPTNTIENTVLTNFRDRQTDIQTDRWTMWDLSIMKPSSQQWVSV